jgi:hypothetical protein
MLNKLKLIGLHITDWLIERWVYVILIAAGFFAGAYWL